ncbi:hypothetical protein AAU57_08335 [Nonlabens sp. YIK11]|uniref:LamB/YcsF family protein n=1 Tax=Nonlabens sp. YIK11 TaxID=1453349 RepID=UPI0006DCD002|nr:LamB/YcsF family protein [Nonlabens sp. YIK11]KQC33323.1 hypothetical protein AAU57_08335 [Nonlabens sp. YIK11]
MKIIDLNCDLGEGMSNDELIMPHISSCNIACGGHAGDADSIKSSLQLAQKFNVRAGAHPSFEDRENFGRLKLDWSRARFRESVTRQLQLFTTTAADLQMKWHHIKMHGALYHATAHEESFAQWTVEWLQEFYPQKPIYSLPKSLLHDKCKEAGQPFIAEAFVDRAYLKNGSLVPRSQQEAVHETTEQALHQLISMAHHNQVTTLDGAHLELIADTYCIHGDNVKLVMQLPVLVKQLHQNQIQVAKYKA